ncbi:MAG: glycosyl hydrolase family 18 protein [Bacteroidales bacterium]|nr:glycosyl hydrolase family 18 protein [Bacteroidales bacterium]
MRKNSIDAMCRKPNSLRHAVRTIAAVITCMVMAAFAASSQTKPAGAQTSTAGKPADGEAPGRPIMAVGYVESFRPTVPDANMFTHLIYAHAGFNEACDGLEIPNLAKLKQLTGLKKENPELKVEISVASSRRDGFSEMAADKKKRKAFAASVRAVLDSLNLDGVNLDWEFPGTENGGHTATPADSRNYVKVVKDIRKAIGKKKEISFYSFNTGDYIDFKGMVPYVDHVYVSGYNLSVPQEGKPAWHQSPLYPSAKLGEWSVSGAVERHLGLGVPREKLLIGIPFYGRGKSPFPSYVACSAFAKYSDGLQQLWDDEAKAPYYADKDGNLVLGYDDQRSIAAKIDFIRENGLPGLFVWNYDTDYADHRLGRTIERLRK